MIEGTLVLLSKDNFEKDIKIATVVQRGDEPMKGSNRFEYMIDIQLERDNPDDPLGFGDPASNNQDTYVMVNYYQYKKINDFDKNDKLFNINLTNSLNLYIFENILYYRLKLQLVILKVFSLKCI